jgi:hypothetical protein
MIMHLFKLHQGKDPLSGFFGFNRNVRLEKNHYYLYRQLITRISKIVCKVEGALIML